MILNFFLPIRNPFWHVRCIIRYLQICPASQIIDWHHQFCCHHCNDVRLRAGGSCWVSENTEWMAHLYEGTFGCIYPQTHFTVQTHNIISWGKKEVCRCRRKCIKVGKSQEQKLYAGKNNQVPETVDVQALESVVNSLQCFQVVVYRKRSTVLSIWK